MRARIVYQAQEKGCGYAAVKMALVHASGRKDFAYAKEPDIGSGQAPSIADLVRYASLMGMKLGAYKARDPREVLTSKSFSPFICVLRDSGRLHAVYVVSASRGRVGFLDPGSGRRTASQEEFSSAMEGTVLLIEAYEDVAPKAEKPRPIGVLAEIAATALSALPPMLLLAGLLLLSFAGRLGLAALSLFLLSLASSLFGKWHISRAMRRFDISYMDGVDSSVPSRRKELFVRYHSYKAAAFSGMPMAISSCLELAASSFFLSFGDPTLGLGIAIMLLALCLKWIFVSPRMEALKREVGGLENDFLSSDSLRRRTEAISGLRNGSARFSSALLAESAFGYVLSVCIGCLCLLMSQPSAERFVFSSLSLMLIYSIADKLRDSFSKMSTKRREEGYFAFHFMRRG